MPIGTYVDRLRLGWRNPAARSLPSAKYRFLDFPDARIRLRVEGEGETTVLLTPDAPVVLENYEELIRILARQCRVIAFEFPGCGFSFPKIGFDFSVEAYTGIVHSVLDATQTRKAVLAFTCVNALVAMAFAKKWPARVERLVLAQAASLPEMKRFGQRIDLKLAGIPVVATPVVGQLAMMVARGKIASMWFKAVVPTASDYENIWSIAKPVFAKGGAILPCIDHAGPLWRVRGSIFRRRGAVQSLVGHEGSRSSRDPEGLADGVCQRPGRHH